jgi:diguanylate cyclase (GGDEF)-like protein/PAS domain S-box-containing protein
MDASGGVYAESQDGTPINAGDEVEVIGFPAKGSYSTVLRSAGIRPTGKHQALTPSKIDGNSALKGLYDARLVTISGTVQAVNLLPGSYALVLRSEDQRNFEATFAGSTASDLAPSIGSKLELTGICSIKTDENGNPSTFEIVLRTPEDAKLLASPPWLTSRRAAFIVTAILALTAAVFGWVLILRKRVRNQTQLIKSKLENEVVLEERYRRVFERNLTGLYIATADDQIIDCNETCAQILGYTSRDALLDNPQAAQLIVAQFHKHLREYSQGASAQIVNAECKFQSVDGSRKCALVNVRLVDQTKTAPAFLEAGLIDITDRKEAEEALLFKTALMEAQSETTIDGILVVDNSNHIVLVNNQFARHFGVPDEWLSRRDDQILLQYFAGNVEAPDVFFERVKYLSDHRDEKSRDDFRLKNGKTFDRYSAPLVDARGQHRGRIWYFRDITERIVAEERVQFLAYFDALTGLPNRTLLQDRMSKALAGAQRRKENVAILFLDLDRFKIINDTLGHSSGDMLLQEVAARLKGCAREQDTVARVGGDEFVLLLTTVAQASDAAVAAQRVLDAVTAEFSLGGNPLKVTCSVGISMFPEHGMNSEALIKNADAAMYSAKQKGPNNIQFFTEDLNDQMVERLTLEKGLRLALDRQEFFLVYQPQMDIATGEIVGVEALLRWQHPDLGLVPPDRFIRIAENTGLIVPIGEWVLKTACAQARKWQDEGFQQLQMAVNVSAVQFRQDGFRDLIRSVLREAGLAPQYLELELTESLLLTNADVMFSVLQDLKEMGLKLAIDDFGTGYSSLSYLRQFPVSKLKIDRSFVQDVANNPDDAAITTAIIGMAKNLNLRVIAEGVENEAQMSFLRAQQCDEIQGYYFSRPLSADKVADMLRCNTIESAVS